MERVDSCVHPKLKYLPNSNKIFQLIWKVDDCNSLFMNSLSCLECMNRPPCPYFSLKPNKYTFPVHQRQSTPEVDVRNLAVLPPTAVVTRKVSKKRAQAGSGKKEASPKKGVGMGKIDCDFTFLFCYEVQQMLWRLKFV
ncbi:hypothetical protein QAD02_007293 [Eretmocerus hayati]|uniref:Uncharacterized protein n=1 Tax=Eretmocerus hayati TaxID=131215 RepID=A0ACC2N3K0_9HYME|nr:hypothetical protein QAD02_007293 [Eretmocerus hayati]